MMDAGWMLEAKPTYMNPAELEVAPGGAPAWLLSPLFLSGLRPVRLSHLASLIFPVSLSSLISHLSSLISHLPSPISHLSSLISHLSSLSLSNGTPKRRDVDG